MFTFPLQTVVTVAVTPQYQAVQVKPTYSSGYSAATTRTVPNVVANLPAKPATYAYQNAQATYGGAAHQFNAHGTATVVSVATTTPSSAVSSGSSESSLRCL